MSKFRCLSILVFSLAFPSLDPAAEFPTNVADEVLIDGVVDPIAARALYDRATSVFQGTLTLLQPVDIVRP